MNTHVCGLIACENSFENTLYYPLHKKTKFRPKKEKNLAPNLHVFCLFCLSPMQARILVNFWHVILHCYTCAYTKIWNFSSHTDLLF